VVRVPAGTYVSENVTLGLHYLSGRVSVQGAAGDAAGDATGETRVDGEWWVGHAGGVGAIRGSPPTSSRRTHSARSFSRPVGRWVPTRIRETDETL
jgi:hypothetical protein